MRSMLFSLPVLIAAGCSVAADPVTPQLSPDVVTPTLTAVTPQTPVERTTARLIVDNVTAGAYDAGAGDGEPTDGPDLDGVLHLPGGRGPEDVAVRVALSAFTSPSWVHVVGDDLDFGFAAFAASQRHLTPGSQQNSAVLLVSVEAHVDDANLVFVTFDEHRGDETVRHVTVITLTSDHDRPLVLDVAPLS